MTRNTVDAPATSLINSIRRFAQYIKPDSGRLLVNAVVIVGIIASSAILIWMVGHGFDLLHTRRFDALPRYFFAVTALVVLLQLLRYANHYLYEWMEQRVIFSIRHALYAHLLLLSSPGIGF